MNKPKAKGRLSWLRFNIAGLVVFVLVCGVAFAALKESTDLWERGVFSGALLLLLLALLLAIHRTGARRAFWVGFALFGGVYLGLTLIPPVESRLISTQGLGYALSKLPGRPTQVYTITMTSAGTASVNPQSITTTTTTISPRLTLSQLVAGNPQTNRIWAMSSGTLLTGWGTSPENFVKIGHTLLALVLGWCGGMLSKRLSGATKNSVSTAVVDRGVLATDGTRIEHG